MEEELKRGMGTPMFHSINTLGEVEKVLTLKFSSPTSSNGFGVESALKDQQFRKKLYYPDH
jgi:hypothetical protein